MISISFAFFLLGTIFCLGLFDLYEIISFSIENFFQSNEKFVDMVVKDVPNDFTEFTMDETFIGSNVYFGTFPDSFKECKLNELVFANQSMVLAMEHFNISEEDQIFNLWCDNSSKWRGSGFNPWQNQIEMGTYDLDNETIFKMVFSHEYAHMVLERMGIRDGYLNEALTDEWMFYSEPTAAAEFAPTRDEIFNWQYNILTSKVNQTCREEVFNGGKINSIKEWLNRYDEMCNVNFVDVLTDVAVKR